MTLSTQEINRPNTGANPLRKKQVVIISAEDWSGMAYQRLYLTRHFLADGHQVIYIQPIRTASQKIEKILVYSGLRKTETGFYQTSRKIPLGLRVFTPFVLSKRPAFQRINKLMLDWQLRKLSANGAIVITYESSLAILKIIERINPTLTLYVKIHDYHSAGRHFPVRQDQLVAELELIKHSNVLLADSRANREKLMRLAARRKVHRAMPGVDYVHFSKAFRGDEIRRRKSIYYFGSIDHRLDWKLHEELADHYQVVMVGTVTRGLRQVIPSNIIIKPPVLAEKLPEELKDADVLALLYQEDDYVRSILPAKFFECLATGKPLIVSGIQELAPYRHLFYDVGNSAQKALAVIENLEDTDTETLRAARLKEAIDADWQNRYDHLVRILREAL